MFFYVVHWLCYATFLFYLGLGWYTMFGRRHDRGIFNCFQISQSRIILWWYVTPIAMDTISKQLRYGEQTIMTHRGSSKYVTGRAWNNKSLVPIGECSDMDCLMPLGFIKNQILGDIIHHDILLTTSWSFLVSLSLFLTVITAPNSVSIIIVLSYS